MAGTTVRMTEDTREMLRQIAREAGRPMQEVLADAVEAYRRQRLLERTNAAFSELRETPAEWQAEREERAAWDATLTDGLSSD